MLNALTGKGLQADSTGSANTMTVYVPPSVTSNHNGRGMINPYPYMSPPFFGTWENPVGAGVRFINKPFSNIDLLHWVKQLGIKYFRGIYSRDNLPQKIQIGNRNH